MVLMWFSERRIDTTIQSKGKRDANIADAEGDRIIFEPYHGIAGGGLSVGNLKSLQDTLRLFLKGSEFTNALVLPVNDFSLFRKIS